MKRISFVGSSLADIKSFPDAARKSAGFQLDRVQRGFDPDDWKPMPQIGSGVREIRIKERPGAFRIIYTASHGAEVFVLHAFVKKTQKTPMHEIELASRRFRALARRLEHGED